VVPKTWATCKNVKNFSKAKNRKSPNLVTLGINWILGKKEKERKMGKMLQLPLTATIMPSSVCGVAQRSAQVTRERETWV
jgi:hypothetical protein